MASWPPLKNSAFSFEVVIRDADGDPVTTGTLSSTLTRDGTAVVGPTPTFVTGGDGTITVTLTAAQNNFDRISAIVKSTAAGAKHAFASWYNVVRQIDDLAFPNVSGRGLDVDATGGAEITANQAVNVAQWNGVAVVVPTVGGVPEVDLTHLGGVAQSATDLKDFADAGYDPVTNKVQGVVLVDTTTTNTDMRGTDGVDTATMRGTDGVDTAAMRGTNNSALASVATEARLAELDAANLPTDVANVQSDTNDIQTRLPAALVGGRMNSDMEAINNVVTSAVRIARSTKCITLGTVGTGSSVTSIVTSSLDPAAIVINQFKGKIVNFEEDTTTAALRGQSTDISASTAAGVLTVTALTTAPVSSDNFTIT